MKDDLALLFRQSGGALLRRDHPAVAARLDRLLARGVIHSPLPGVLTAGAVVTPEARILAGALWAGPDAVVCGRAAARLGFWPDAAVPVVDLAAPVRGKSRPGWTVTRRRLPPELLAHRGAIRFTSPALTAVDLAAGPGGGDVIDRVLRTRTGTLAQMWRALELTPGRRGNRQRAVLLTDSRDQPWSEAERELHRLLRRAGIDGWRTNVPIGPWFVDVCFGRHRLVIEVDGFETHATRPGFESDRFRRDELVLRGCLVLNFTWRQIVDDPGWVVGCIRRALDLTGAGSRPSIVSGNRAQARRTAAARSRGEILR